MTDETQRNRPFGANPAPAQMAHRNTEYGRSVARMAPKHRRDRGGTGGMGAGMQSLTPALVLGGLALIAWMWRRKPMTHMRSEPHPDDRNPGRRDMDRDWTQHRQPRHVGSASGLQPGGTIPGRSPAAGAGAIGTGGGSTAGVGTGSAGSS